MATGVLKEVGMTVGGVRLRGVLEVPAGSVAIVVFVHGSGSGRYSLRNAYVAGRLREAGFGTLLFDLLTEREDADVRNRFDIDLLSERLLLVTGWLRRRRSAKGLPIGYFGASTGAAAALRVAGMSQDIGAVVARGGRPDLAIEHLSWVHCPVLLIVGAADHEVLRMNRRAFEALQCPKEMLIVEGATHLFEEPGCLEEVAEAAAEWFTIHLTVKSEADEIP